MRAWSRRGRLALVLALAGCRPAPTASPVSGTVVPHEPHAQVIHAMKTGPRRELVERLRARNPPGWTVNEDALVRSLTVLDPFAGFLRRARRDGFVRPTRAEGPVDEAVAASRAREFVKRNADLLGVPRHIVPALAEHVRRPEPADHAAPRAAWVVRFEALFASKGYESFKELENAADLEVLVDDDGEVSSFVNVSRIHPHLTIDARPVLAADDPRLVAHIVGRKLFALERSEQSDDALTPHDLAGVQALRRIPLGEARGEDVARVQLVVHMSPGPQLAWLTYRLAYLIELAKPAHEVGGALHGRAPRFFFFRYIVDADGGEVLEDARAPLMPATAEPPP